MACEQRRKNYSMKSLKEPGNIIQIEKKEQRQSPRTSGPLVRSIYLIESL